MKKIKVEDKLRLSHDHLETILYQSLKISASDQYVKTNRLALLSVIIRNKINDLTVSVAPEKEKTRKVEVAPAWVANRHEQEELTKEKKAYFAQERERILAKLREL